MTRILCNRLRDAFTTDIRARKLHISLNECFIEYDARAGDYNDLSSSFLYAEEQQLKAVKIVF